MTFSYSNSLSTDRDKIRFYIRDTVSGSGPLPLDANFSDEELDGLLSAEGIWQRAVAAAFETLAAAWRPYPTFQADGISLSRSHISRGYDNMAAAWRKTYGYSTGDTVTDAQIGMGTSVLVLQDGYSDDISSVETE